MVEFEGKNHLSRCAFYVCSENKEILLLVSRPESFLLYGKFEKAREITPPPTHTLHLNTSMMKVI